MTSTAAAVTSLTIYNDRERAAEGAVGRTGRLEAAAYFAVAPEIDRNYMVFFVICFATVLFMEPFENWKFVPKILHVEFYSKQD